MAEYDAGTVLLVVDVQNDFADPGGSLYVSGGEEIVPIVNGEIAKAGQAGALVVYTRDWHPASTPHFVTAGGIWPVHCVRDTWGAEFHPQLVIDGPSIKKGLGGEDGYSGFSLRDPETGDERPTGLGILLDRRRVRSAVIVGLALDYCVKATALDAVREGLTTTVLLAATRAVELREGDGERALAELAAAGVAVE